MNEASQIEPPPVYNQQDVASRHAELFKNLPTGETAPEAGTDLAEVAAQQLSKKSEPEKKAEKSADVSGIPDEILGKETPKEQDEWEKLHGEEVKGHVKNENWKRYKEATGKKVGSLEQQLAAKEKELIEYKSKFREDAVPEKVAKEIELYQTKLKEREDELGKIAVERSPMFKEKFTNRQESLVSQIKKAGEELELESATQLIGMSLKKRLEILSESSLSPAAQGHISSLLREHDQIEMDKGAFLADWESRKTEMEQQEQAQSDSQKARMKEHEDAIFNKTLEALAENFAPLKKVEGREDWNKGRQEIIEAAKAFFDGEFSTESFAEVVLTGFAGKRLGQINDHLIKQVREMKAELESLRAANPDVPDARQRTPEDGSKDGSRFTRNDAHKAFRDIVGAARLNEVS
jgi:hypothetical protein